MGCWCIAGLTPSIKFATIHLCTWVERGTVRVKCLAQEHNAMSPVRNWTQTSRSEGRRLPLALRLIPISFANYFQYNLSITNLCFQYKSWFESHLSSHYWTCLATFICYKQKTNCACAMPSEEKLHLGIISKKAWIMPLSYLAPK